MAAIPVQASSWSPHSLMAKRIIAHPDAGHDEVLHRYKREVVACGIRVLRKER